MTAGDQFRPAHDEGAPDVLAACRGVEVGLWHGGRCSPQRVEGDGHTPDLPEMRGQKGRLVVATLSLAARVKRYGHEQIGRGSRQSPQAQFCQQLGERGRQGAATAELEGMKRLPRDGSIAHRRPRIRKWPPARPALAAEPLDGQREAAAPAPWWRDALESLPACPAQWIAAADGNGPR